MEYGEIESQMKQEDEHRRKMDKKKWKRWACQSYKGTQKRGDNHSQPGVRYFNIDTCKASWTMMLINLARISKLYKTQQVALQKTPTNPSKNHLLSLAKCYQTNHQRSYPSKYSLTECHQRNHPRIPSKMPLKKPSTNPSKKPSSKPSKMTSNIPSKKTWQDAMKEAICWAWQGIIYQA